MESTERRCDLCGESSMNMRRCTGCYRKFYCSRSCQKTDWIVHKPYCKETGHKSANEGKSSAARTGKSQVETTLLPKCSFCAAQCKLMSCGSCKITNYCSKRCQKLDWSTHKHSCKSTESEHNRHADEHKEVSEDSVTKCLKCAGTNATRRCTGCYVASYCSKRCQEQDWARHKLTCKKTIKSSKKNNETRKRTAEATTEERGTPSQQEDRMKAINSGICQSCGVFGPIKTCSACKSTTYCSKNCQKKDWAKHKLDCISHSEGIDAEDIIKTKGFRKYEYEQKKTHERESKDKEFSFPPFQSLFGPGLFMAPEHRIYARRPPGSLERAKEIATQRFPGKKIIDDFNDMPDEYFLMFGRLNIVLVAFMFKYHEHVVRHGAYLKDKDDAETHVEFYLEYDNPAPFFSYKDIRPGNYICLENACLHHFMDGTTGIRIDDPSDVQVIILPRGVSEKKRHNSF